MERRRPLKIQRSEEEGVGGGGDEDMAERVAHIFPRTDGLHIRNNTRTQGLQRKFQEQNRALSDGDRRGSG